MRISTRGRYALRALVDLALNDADGFIPIKDVAVRQEISLKYLESIMPILRRHKLVEVATGRGGGYRLAIPPANAAWEMFCALPKAPLRRLPVWKGNAGNVPVPAFA